jgi:hypothetical protein
MRGGGGELPFCRLLPRYIHSNIDILQGKHSQIPASLQRLVRYPSLDRDGTSYGARSGTRRGEQTVLISIPTPRLRFVVD